MAKRRGSGIPGVSFSWKRAAGISSARSRVARATGIPTTRGGRQRKVGSMVTGGGCMTMIALVLLALTAVILAGCTPTSVRATSTTGDTSKYTQTWTKEYKATTCGDWNDEMTEPQRWALSADVLTSARNKVDGGTGLPSDSLVTEFERNLTTACEVEDSEKVLEIAYYVYNYDATFKP